MKNRENYNYTVNFIKKEAKDTEKQGYYVYDIFDFLLEVEENLINGNSKIANQIYNDEINYYKADNSYNWDSNINNDIEFKLYEINDEIYVKLNVHMYGDIRNNYTDDIILKFENEKEFFEKLTEATGLYLTIQIDNGEIFLNCDIFDEIVNVEFEDNCDNYTSSNSSEIGFTLWNTKEEIKEKLKEYFKN